jgi:hypothetical protein
MAMEDELKEMNEVLTQDRKEEKVEPEVKEEEAVKEEEKKKESEAKVEPEVEKKEEEKKEEPKKEEEKELKPDSKQEELLKQLTDLRAELAVLKAEHKPSEEKEEPKQEVKEPEPAEQDFVGTLDLDEVTRDPKELNKLLNTIYKKAVTDNEKAIISKLPDLVRTHIETVQAITKAGEEFYRTNEDLKSFKKVVAVVYDELSKQDPNRTLEEMMKETAIETRKRLELPEPKAKTKEEEKKETKKEAPPKLPSKGTSAGKITSSEKPDALQSELEEMNKVLMGAN